MPSNVAITVLLCLLSVSPLHAGYLKDRDLARIRLHWQEYDYAAKVVGIPVEILPAIHYRESGLLDGWYSHRMQQVRENIGGPFMLDLGGDGPAFEARIRAYEAKIFKLYVGEGPAPRVSNNFDFACLVAAHELKTKMRKGKGLADAVWGYNGRAKGATLKTNAYTWNNPIKGHKMIAKYRDRHGEIVSYIDERPGVMVIYGEILRLQKDGLL
jgi:hypothetical protein